MRIGFDPASAVQHLRVDDAADAHVDVVRAQALQEAQRPRTRDLELREAGLVEQRGPFPGGERARPRSRSTNARRPSHAGRRPSCAGSSFEPEPVGSLPPGLLADSASSDSRREYAGGILSGRRRRSPRPGTGCRSGLRRSRTPSRARSRGSGTGGRSGGRPSSTSPSRARRRRSTPRSSGRSRRRRSSVCAEPRRHEQAADLGLAEDEVVVGRERLGAVDEPVDLRRLQRRDQPERAVRDRFESLPVLS